LNVQCFTKTWRNQANFNRVTPNFTFLARWAKIANNEKKDENQNSAARKAIEFTLERMENNMENSIPKPFVFVLMPFDVRFKEIYELGIKQACKDAGAYCERVDEQIYEESILERIYNQISKADIVISDMTNRNPNVFYETGYAHALGKRVILLTQNAEDIPFDLKHYPHIIYENDKLKLKSELGKRIAWYINNPQKQLLQIENNLSFYINLEPLKDNTKIKINAIHEKSQYVIVLKMSIQNSGNKLIKDDINISLITPGEFNRSKEIIELPDGKCLHHLVKIDKIYPQQWFNEKIVLPEIKSINYHVANKKVSMILRIFTEIGVADYPFSVIINYEANDDD